jgi:hypothetical protein
MGVESLPPMPEKHVIKDSNSPDSMRPGAGLAVF